MAATGGSCAVGMGILMPECTAAAWAARTLRAAGKRPAPAQKPIRNKSRRLIMKNELLSVPARRIGVGASLGGWIRRVRHSLGRPGMLWLGNFSTVSEVGAGSANADGLRCALDLVGVDGAGKSSGERAWNLKLDIERNFLAIDRSRQGGRSALVQKSALQLVGGVLLKL